MKRDFSGFVLDLHKQPLRLGGNPDNFLRAINDALDQLDDAPRQIMIEAMNVAGGAELSFAAACADALIAPLPGEDALPLGERSKRMALALRIVDGGNVDITSEERETIKECATKYFKGSLVPARIEQMLESG